MSEVIHLLIADGPEKGSEITVPPGGAVVGRDENAEIFLEREELSRRHCRFFFRSWRLHVQDLESSNNTHLNNEVVKEDALSEHDVVAAGSVKFMVVLNKITPAYDLGKLQDVPRTDHPAPPGTKPVPAPEAEKTPSGIAGNIVVAVIGVLILGFLAISVLYPPPGKVRIEIRRTPVTIDPVVPPAKVVIDNTDALEAFKQQVAEKLIEEDAKTASSWITEHLAPGQSRKYQQELSEMLKISEAVASINSHVADSFRQRMGEPMTIHRDGREIHITPRAVLSFRVEASLREGTKERSSTFNIPEMSARDRLEWIPYPTTPQQHAMHFVLQCKAGDSENARRHAQKAGVMSEAFSDALAQASRE